MNWNAEPVFFDFETQSAADIKSVGGRGYARDASTRVLTLTVLADKTYHVWTPRGPIIAADVWPSELGAGNNLEVCVYSGGAFPASIAQLARERLWIAHNAWGFDEHIWREKVYPLCGVMPVFADSLPIARAAGLPGRLDALARAMFDQGKHPGHAVLKRYWGSPDTVPPPGAMTVIARYNIVDVALLARVWDELDIEIETDVLAAHHAINSRGVAIDAALLRKIQQVSNTSEGRAGEQIAKLTATADKPEGVLNGSNIRSVKQVHAWLATQGVRIHDYTGKASLRREIVDQAIANPWMMLHEDAPITATKSINPAVFDVLRLRAASLRITGAKAAKGLARDIDGRAYDLFSYHQAHTGRWSSVGIQVHNLPRSKKGVDVEGLLNAHTSGEWSGNMASDYDTVAKYVKGKTTVDDALGSLLRPVFTAASGKALLIADYNAIECRGLAWIAGEEWLLQAFRDKDNGADIDPYKAMARQVFALADLEPVSDEQRQVGKIIILGCGYAMSAEKFGIFCGLSGVNLEAAGVTAESCVDAYRKAHPAIAGKWAGEINGRAYRRGGVWDQLNGAAMTAVCEGGVYRAGKCAFSYDGSTLYCVLPSGRKLRYRNARIEDRVPGYALALGLNKTKATLVYDRPQGGTASLYGGKIAENVVQAICRDLLATALVRLEAAGIPVVLHVHDEIVCEVALSDVGVSLERFASIMATPPSWADGFPVAVEGYAAPRYLKKRPDGWPSVTKHG